MPRAFSLFPRTAASISTAGEAGELFNPALQPPSSILFAGNATIPKKSSVLQTAMLLVGEILDVTLLGSKKEFF